MTSCGRISAHKLAIKNIGRDKLLWAIFFVSAAVTAITQSEIAWLVIAAGVLVYLARIEPKFGSSALGVALPVQLPQLLPLASDPNKLIQITVFFTKAGAFVFGSGLAIVPFLYGGVVTEHHWLTDKQFVDAVAVAMITPGPVVITTGFIGYLVAGLPGATLAAAATFMPCYLITIIAAPHLKKYGKRQGLIAFVDGLTAAAVGAIAGSVVVLAQRSITDIPTVLLAVCTTALLWKIKKVPEPVIVAAAALIGLAIYPLMHHT